jgi:D-alanine-D-alanine ligase
MSEQLRIGISFDHPDEYPEVDGPEDRFAEFEPETTILAMEDAIRYLNHVPVRVGGPRELLVHRPEVDVIWNISEGYGSRNREAWVPVICELYSLPCLGSDALTQSMSLDKLQSKKFAREVGIPTSASFVITADELISEPHIGQQVTHTFGDSAWPLFIKPRYEGTGKGITASSVCHSIEQLVKEASRQKQVYQQDLLIERFLSGAEYTVAVSGNPLRAHPVLERGLDADTGIGLHVLDALRARSATPAAEPHSNYTLSHQLSFEIEARIRTWSLMLCQHMQIRDYARLDFKLDSLGNPHFLEVNPLPTFAVDNTFAILAELESKPYDEFLGGILQSALLRAGVAR